jgi:hypothetical protein
VPELGHVQVERCAKLGIQIDPASSKTLANSLRKCERREGYAYTVMPALSQMLMKCMHLAQYFCTGTVEGQVEFRHYALSVDLYGSNFMKIGENAILF